MDGKNSILFSIIMPTYRREKLIGASIQSVVDQSYTNWELIIVEDRNESRNEALTTSFKDKRIIYQSSNGRGRSQARNRGIDMAKGSFLCFLDDDDLYHPDFLLEMEKFIRKNEEKQGLYFCKQDELSKEGNLIYARQPQRLISDKINFLIEEVQNFQSFCTSSSFFEEDRFGEKFEIGEDFHLLLRLFLKHPVFFLDQSLCLYRNHDQSTMERELSEQLYLNSKHNRLYVMDDLWSNFSSQIKKGKGQKRFWEKYNKISLFYLSDAMKMGKWSFFFKHLFKMRIWTLRFFSLVLRLPYYLLKSLITSRKG